MPTAEDKNADGAKRAGLRTPKPPSPIGRLACIQPMSVMSVLSMSDSPVRNIESNRSRSA